MNKGGNPCKSAKIGEIKESLGLNSPKYHLAAIDKNNSFKTGSSSAFDLMVLPDRLKSSQGD